MKIVFGESGLKVSGGLAYCRVLVPMSPSELLFQPPLEALQSNPTPEWVSISEPHPQFSLPLHAQFAWHFHASISSGLSPSQLNIYYLNMIPTSGKRSQLKI